MFWSNSGPIHVCGVAEDREHAGHAVAAFKLAYGGKFGMAFRVRLRAVDAPQLVALVRAGARFDRGKLVERPQPPTAQGKAA